MTEATSQPILDETQEFRREADRRRTRAIARLEEVDSHIETHKAIIEQLQAERNRLILLSHAAESVLTIIDPPTFPVLSNDASKSTDESSTTE